MIQLPAWEAEPVHQTTRHGLLAYDHFNRLHKFQSLFDLELYY